MKFSLTIDEKNQVQYLLPMQGNMKTLETVQQILFKISNSQDETIDFSEDEILFLRKHIKILDENQKIFLSSLSLVKKILE